MNEKKENRTKAWWQPALMMFGRLSAWIVAPVLFGTFVGKWLDAKEGTEPFFLVSAVGISFLFSMVGLVKETMKEYKRIEEDDKKNKNNSNIKI